MRLIRKIVSFISFIAQNTYFLFQQSPMNLVLQFCVIIIDGAVCNTKREILCELQKIICQVSCLPIHWMYYPSLPTYYPSIWNTATLQYYREQTRQTRFAREVRVIRYFFRRLICRFWPITPCQFCWFAVGMMTPTRAMLHRKIYHQFPTNLVLLTFIVKQWLSLFLLSTGVTKRYDYISACGKEFQ